MLTNIYKTEEELKEGLSVVDVQPFFEKFSLCLRVLDIKYQCVYKYDPPKPNTKHRVMYVLCSNDHVYTCDAIIMSVSHKIENQELTDENKMYVSNYFLKHLRTKKK